MHGLDHGGEEILRLHDVSGEPAALQERRKRALRLRPVDAIDRRFAQVARSMGASRWNIFRRIVLPGLLPSLLVGMEVSIGITWEVVVAAEMIALRSGLGYLIIDSRNAGNRYDLVIAGMIIIGLIGLMLDGFMRLLESMKVVRWRYAH